MSKLTRSMVRHFSVQIGSVHITGMLAGYVDVFNMKPTLKQVDAYRDTHYPEDRDTEYWGTISRVKAIRRLTGWDIKTSKLYLDLLLEDQNDAS